MLSPRTLRTKAAGIEQSVLHVSRFLKDKGVNIEILCTASDPKGKIEYEGVSMHEFSAFAPGEAYFYSAGLFEELKKKQADIIHCNGFNNLVSVLGILAKKPNQKLVITMNSSGASSFLRKVLRFPLTWFYKKFSKRLDKVICVSKWEYDFFKKTLPLPEERFIMIPNGIEAGEFQKIKLPKIPHSILTVGRLVKNKGMHRLIAAMPFVLEKHSDATLQIVGEGIEKERLQKQAKELHVENSIVFHGVFGFEEREKLLELYAKAHAFSLLTDMESQGIVFGEAVAAGLPVLAPNKGVMKEYVDAGVALGIEELDNPKIVGEKLIELFEMEQDFQKANEIVWSWERVGKAVLEVYQELQKQD
jgi:glycosyltransferase involved in cell wall biosynthesis